MNHHKIILSDVYSGLYHLENNSIDLAVTSPPYWNQRDYGIPNQIGCEETPFEYISKLNKIFQLLKNKMNNDGVFFLNIGDKYISKYGNTPIGFIPYKLANEMTKSGWILSDIIIWFKPNHMPSSIKNRFTNSYEPVFVLSPSKDNIYTKKRCKENILKINLQPTQYKHVAAFPEKLVEALIKKVQLKNQSNILDPFAGSGTTLKVIKKMDISASGIMIEKNIDYINIIKNRCNLNGDYTQFNYDEIEYFNFEDFQDEEQLNLFKTNYLDSYNKKLKQGLISILEKKEDYYKLLEKFKSQTIKYKYSPTSIFFIGSKEFDLDLILETETLNKKGWIIRNMIIVQENDRWFPLFFIVDDNKRYSYKFRYENLNLKSKNNYNRQWSSNDLLGLKVVDSINKKKKNGKIIDILKSYTNNFPMYVLVKWENGEVTREYVIQNLKEVNENVFIKRINSNILIEEQKELIGLNKRYLEIKKELSSENIKKNNSTKNDYNGKFLNEKRINWGASPGARSSVDEEYFSLQRLYNVNQNLVADYLNNKRIEKELSKNQLTEKFPDKYRHTVGHWLRKDFGGSIPTPEDWEKLSKFLDIDEIFTNYVCKTALKLQTVKHAEFKVPKDFIKKSFVNKLKLLYQD